MKSEYQRGRPRPVSMLVGDKVREGHDLGDVLRDILHEAMEAHGWDQAGIATQLGMAQSTVSRILSGQSDGKIELLTRLCIVLDRNPASLLASHPLYDRDAREKLVYPKDHLYQRFVRILNNGHAADLLSMLSDASELGLLPDLLESGQRLLASVRKASGRTRPNPRKASGTHRKPGGRK